MLQTIGSHKIQYCMLLNLYQGATCWIRTRIKKVFYHLKFDKNFALLNSIDLYYSLSDDLRAYSLKNGPADTTRKKNTAAGIRKDLEGLLKLIKAAHDNFCHLLGKCRKAEHDEEVRCAFF